MLTTVEDAVRDQLARARSYIVPMSRKPLHAYHWLFPGVIASAILVLVMGAVGLITLGLWRLFNV